MVEVNSNKQNMIKIEKKNILYISFGRIPTNFYLSIEHCPFCKLFYRDDIENLSLESYDAYIVSFEIFKYGEDKVIEVLEKIYSFNKPVILIYQSGYRDDYIGYSYLKSKFNINLEKKDASIIDNSYEGYKPYNAFYYAVSMVSNNGFGKAYIRNTQNCFILRFGNISIIHDVELTYTDKNGNFVQQLPTLLLNLLEMPKQTEEPEWIDEIKILDEINIENEIKTIDAEISKLESEKERQLKKLKENNDYKKVLYTSGDELVNIVKKMLKEMLNITINDLDVKKEDLSFDLDDKKILVEIKGVNTAIKREYISQMQRHIEDDARENNIEDDDMANKYKGLLIVNPYIKIPAKERITKEFYSNTVKADIKYHNICTIDTITFLSIFQEFKKGKDIDFKNIILNNNYNEPIFSIIDKI